MANLRRKEKTNGLVGAKNRGGEGQPKVENEWIIRGNLRKKEKTNGLVRAKNRGRGGLT